MKLHGVPWLEAVTGISTRLITEHHLTYTRLGCVGSRWACGYWITVGCGCVGSRWDCGCWITLGLWLYWITLGLWLYWITLGLWLLDHVGAVAVGSRWAVAVLDHGWAVAVGSRWAVAVLDHGWAVVGRTADVSTCSPTCSPSPSRPSSASSAAYAMAAPHSIPHTTPHPIPHPHPTARRGHPLRVPRRTPHPSRSFLHTHAPATRRLSRHQPHLPAPPPTRHLRAPPPTLTCPHHHPRATCPHISTCPRHTSTRARRPLRARWPTSSGCASNPTASSPRSLTGRLAVCLVALAKGGRRSTCRAA
jgi:hypothetical protein